MALPLNTTKGDTTMKKTRENRRRGLKTLNRDMDINTVNQTWRIDHVDCRHGEKIERKCRLNYSD